MPPHSATNERRDMTTKAPAAIKLSLIVQYGAAEPTLTRARLRRWVQRALDGAARELPLAAHTAQIGVRLAGLAEARRLNRDFRGRDYATNVLTFEYGADPSGVLRGDIILCAPVLKREAREQKKTLLAHAAHLTIHGVLHALGYDHLKTREANRMEKLESRILLEMGIDDPYAPR
jgi:probable rRNA maturation factor